MLEDVTTAFGILSSADVITALLLGTLVGMLVAIMPGLGAPTAMGLLLPLTFGMDTSQALAFLVAIMAASGFAGSLTAILVGVPGDGTNAATLLNGFPLSQQGKAGVAIGASATASALGALFGVVILLAAIPIVRNVILAFGPPEVLVMALGGVLMIGSLSSGRPLRGVVTGFIGMMLGFIGFNVVVGGTRYTFGSLFLMDGIPLVPALIGLFALPEMIFLLRKERAISREGIVIKGGILLGVREVLSRPGLLLRSSAIGTGLGVVPGVGGAVAPWVSYFSAINASKHPEEFGKGVIEGVIAPESANDSKDGGALMPLLALGIPGSLTTAILLGAFLIHGVSPGRRLFDQDMPLVLIMVFALVIANVLTSVVGITAANLLVKITLIPAAKLAPIVIAVAFVGAFASTLSMFGVLVAVVFCIIGYVMVRAGYPRPGLLLGLVLLPLIERNLHLSLQIYRGSYAFLLRPLAMGLLVATVFAITAPRGLRALKSRREKSRTDRRRSVAGGVAEALQGQDEVLTYRDRRIELVFLVVLLGVLSVASAMAIGFGPRAQLLPFVVFVPFALVLILNLHRAVREFRGLVPELDDTSEVSVVPDWWIVVWIMAMPLFMWLIGTLWAVLPYIVGFGLIFRRRTPTWKATLQYGLMAVATAAVSWFLFSESLAIRFQDGLLF